MAFQPATFKKPLHPELRLAQNIRAIRMRLGLSTVDMSNLCGVSYHTYLRIERRLPDPAPLKTLATIAHALHITLDELVF